ncbi:bifunctional DNA primase/polymerase [Actinomadura hibisca]|uniref:bifunctional DNA primase/polymerase n=1 Tax=Actinomadura hibisca TaxID=68565 RepID=UPI0008294EAF|nr:bifunctional DNA primase/polymerase [Actinomadura hibisca]
MQILDLALQYAAIGWPVFPCRPNGKAPLAEHLDHSDHVVGAVHGFHDATTDPDVIRSWWGRWPTANLAWPTGEPTGDVLDIDVRPTGSGWAALNRLKRAGLIPPPRAAAQTPSGGLHLYFPGTSQPSSALPAHHLDFKAAGGYVLAPPSAINGRPYQWIDLTDQAPSAPLDWAAIRQVLVPASPPQLIKRPASRGGITALTRAVARTPEGNRNSILFWATCRAVAEGNTELTALLDAAVHAGLPETEARRTIASARRRVTPAARASTTASAS